MDSCQSEASRDLLKLDLRRKQKAEEYILFQRLNQVEECIGNIHTNADFENSGGKEANIVCNLEYLGFLETSHV